MPCAHVSAFPLPAAIVGGVNPPQGPIAVIARGCQVGRSRSLAPLSSHRSLVRLANRYAYREVRVRVKPRHLSGRQSAVRQRNDRVPRPP